MRSRVRWRIPCLAFLLPAAILLAVFIIDGVYPFGDRSFLTADLYHQYMPFLREFIHKLKAAESLDFSFHLGIGSNFMALFVYYLASPFHLAAVLVPESHLVEFISYLVVIKTGLCGLTCFLYFQSKYQEDFVSCLFALFYALSGFMAAYSYNIMWLDCVILLPLVILGLERLVQEKKPGLYCVTLALCIFSNYYLSIMICIFLVLYFGLLLLTVRGALRRIGAFVFYSVLAGGLAAVLLIPEVCAILQTDFGKISFPENTESYFSILDVLARHCLGVQTERGLDHWPNIYCGSVVLLLIPLYFANEQIPLRERFAKFLLTGFLLVSFSTNLLDFLWHGLNYPDSLPARQSFLYVFLVLVMSREAFEKRKEQKPKSIVYGYGVGILFLLFCEKFVTDDALVPGVIAGTGLFLTIYAVLLYYDRTRNDRRIRLWLAVLTLAAVVAECGINTWNTGAGTTVRQDYLEQEEDYRNLYLMVREREEGFCRVESFTRMTKNDGTLAGYPSATLFSSTMNSDVMKLYKRLGMRYSKVFYCYDGATAFTGALLNVNYMFGPSDEYTNSLFKLLADSGETYLYECQNTLPFGYVAPTGFDLPEGDESETIEIQNELVRQLGVPGKLFEKEKGQTQGDDICFTAKKGGIYYGRISASGTSRVDCIGGSVAEMRYKDLKKGSILYLGYLEQGQSVTLTNGNNEDVTPRIAVELYRLNEEVLEEALGILGESSMEDVEVESDHLRGKLSLDHPGRLILSIPAEAGWHVKINGVETKPEQFGGCLMAFDLDVGEYELELVNRPVGAVAGLLVSLISVTLFAGVRMLQKRKGKE